jgi:hypothetical protein
LSLEAIGLTPGAAVRFRREDGTRWLNGAAKALNRDGSLDLTDARGRARSIPVEQVEVRERGPRGGDVWTPLTEIADRTEQLDLFG